MGSEWNDFLLTEEEYEWETKAVSSGLLVRWRKKPELLIKKSGKTWILKHDGNDRICVNPNNWWFDEGDKDKIKEHILLFDYTKEWPLIKDIQITDDIALLRPMVDCTVKNEYRRDMTLIGVEGDKAYYSYTSLVWKKGEEKYQRNVDYMNTKNCRILSADEL